jgi:hypothetical protein
MDPSLCIYQKIFFFNSIYYLQYYKEHYLNPGCGQGCVCFPALRASFDTFENDSKNLFV